MNNLKKLTIPIFGGRVKNFESWKAIFNACVDSAEGTKEEKLIHLRQYLVGEPIKLIDPLSFSGAAYDVAKKRLEERYRGDRRAYANILEKIENARPLRAGESILIVRMKDLGKEVDLGDVILKQKLLKKLPEGILTLWHRRARQIDMQNDEGVSFGERKLKSNSFFTNTTKGVKKKQGFLQAGSSPVLLRRMSLIQRVV